MLSAARVLGAPSRRTGFTLVEMLVVLVFLGIIGGAIVTLLWRQQRFYNSATEVLNTRQQIRQAAFMLPSDLRGISRIGGDIYAMTDSSIEFRSVFGSSVTCSINGGKVSTVPVRLATGSAMTNWKAAPVVNDSIALYDDMASTAVKDDVWRLYRITGVVQVTGNNNQGCPTVSGLAQAVDLVVGNPSYQITMSTSAPATVSVGAAIRIFRRVHYSLYKSPADAKWYLAYFDCVPNRAPVCATPQPIAGPLRPYAASAVSGLQFTYYDSTGVVTADKALVARISVVARAQGEALINLTGTGAIPLRDSLRLEVALRNRN